MCCACTPTVHGLASIATIRGCATFGRRRQALKDRGEPGGPTVLTTDGCSPWPDGSWGQCCIDHDMDYWCGGP
jgi:hypothetical protein